MAKNHCLSGRQCLYNKRVDFKKRWNYLEKLSADYKIVNCLFDLFYACYYVPINIYITLYINV